MIDLFVAFVAGVLVGMGTGLLPGLHINVVAVLVAACASAFAPFPLAIFLATAATVHAFFDVIPGLFLGVPADEAYALLPGQRLVREGEGATALALSMLGSLGGLLLAGGAAALLMCLEAADLSPLESLCDTARPWLGLVLWAVSLVLVATEPRRLWALSVFLSSGVLGLLAFTTCLAPKGAHAAFTVVFPALSGLFGISGLVLSLMAPPGGPLPAQRPMEAPQVKVFMPSVLVGGIGGMLVGLLPGLGAANMAALLSLGRNEVESNRSYLVTTSAINSADSVIGILALYFIHRARSGVSVALEQFMPGLRAADVAWIVGTMLLAGFVAAVMLRAAGTFIASLLARQDHRRSAVVVILFVVILTGAGTGGWGLLFLVAATLIGMVAPVVEVRRAQAMGFFLLPMALFFSGWLAPVVSLLRLEMVYLP